MNRAQRRAAAKGGADRRLGRMDRHAYDRYRARVLRYLVGARFEGVPVTREEDGEIVYGLSGQWRFPPTVPAHKWERVADYAEHAPLRWHLEVEAVFRDDRGDEYREQVEGEVGQQLLLAELTDQWRGMLDEARGRGNARHHWADVVRCRPLTGRG